eukprot:9710-Amphidinium_carterae.1
MGSCEAPTGTAEAPAALSTFSFITEEPKKLSERPSKVKLSVQFQSVQCLCRSRCGKYACTGGLSCMSVLVLPTGRPTIAGRLLPTTTTKCRHLA